MIHISYIQEDESDFHNIAMVMLKCDERFGFSVIGGTDEGFIARIDDVTEGLITK